MEMGSRRARNKRARWVRRLISPLLLFVLLAHAQVLAAKDRIGILATGEVLPGECPLENWLKNEPGFDITLIPTKADFLVLLSLQDARRLVRVYFPRTQNELVENYRFLAFIDTDLSPYTSSQMNQMKSAIADDGLSAFVSLGGGIFTFNYGMWASSELATAFPHDFLVPSSGQLAPAFRIEVNRKPDLPRVLKMFIPVGIESVIGKTWGRVRPPVGSTTWAWIRPIGSSERSPFMASMPLGTNGATTWAIADDLDHPWWSSVYEPSNNEYAQDVFLNVIHFSLGHMLPADIMIVHAIRIRFVCYESWKGITISTIDFLERFGVPTASLLANLGSLDAEFDNARRDYAKQEYDKARAIMDSLLLHTQELDQRAIQMRRRFLFWIHATEWLATTATFLLAAIALHFLMVRRGRYHMPGTTRFDRF